MPWLHRVKKVPLLIVLLIGMALIFLQFTREISLFSPVQKSMKLVFNIENQVYRSAIHARSWLTFFANRASLERRYQAMERQYKSVIAMESECKEAQEENISLRKAIHFIEQSSTSPIVASVIGIDARRFHNTLIIDRGRNDGIREGDAVVADDGILIGKIFSLFEHTSTVLLLYDNQSKVAATLQTHERTLGIVEGSLGLTLIFDLIPKDIVIPKGTIVITSGLETGIPRGLLIGTVQDVQSQPYNLFQKALIIPLVDYYQYPLILVLTNSYEL